MARNTASVDPSGVASKPAPEGNTRPATPAGHARLLAIASIGCGDVTFEGVKYVVGADGAITVPEHAVPHILPHGFTQLVEG